MPPRINNEVQAAGSGYQDPFIAKADYPAIVKVDVTALDDDAIDSGGYLKPGFLLTEDGAPISTGDTVYGAVPEAMRVATSNSDADIAAGLAAHPVAVITIGQLSRDAIEYNLGRALNADEEAGFVDGGSLKLLQ
jgi:hypothetical protein